MSTPMAHASISTHVLDTARGTPAGGVALTLAVQSAQGWTELGRGLTDADGRCRTLLEEHALQAAVYRLHLETEPYFRTQGLVPLYPFVEIVFRVVDAAQHHHIPLLCTAHGYTTYRGS